MLGNLQVTAFRRANGLTNRQTRARLFSLAYRGSRKHPCLAHRICAPYAAIDPYVGDGIALLEITKDTDAHLAGIELDADRTSAAARKGIATVHGSAFECRALSETCSLLYLNPPYDTEYGPHSNRRMELVFLEHCYRWVASEGALVFVLPAPAVGTCARLLANQFDRICVFRLEHPESVRFNQVVVFGKRKKAHLRGEPKGAEELLRIAC